MTLLFFNAAFALALAIFLVPRSWKGYASLLPTLFFIMSSSTWAVEALAGHSSLRLDFLASYWSGNLSLVIDRMSAFFILIINMTCLTGAIYGLRYMKPYFEKKGSVSISLHLCSFVGLHGSMLLVVMLRDGLSFLVAWELMSLFSFILVIFEGEKEPIIKTGINYLLQMHVCFVVLLIGFLSVANVTGSFSLDALTPYFAGHNNLWIFLLFFLGFGIKAGFVPLHSWLPHAHPAAPAHVSGVMSGVMIKMGIYGILRVLSQVQSQFLEIGFFVLVTGMATALTGILYSIFQKDIKKTLAYSSIENVGIIGLGIGLAVVGKGLDSQVLMTMALLGSLLHILNHSLYKSLLFFSAGNIYYSTHSRDLDKLGGLANVMPFTAVAFLAGSLAICGIPPLNGFTSEFLLYSGVFENISQSAFEISLLDLVILLSLVAVGGLSLFGFTKTFGLALLGSRRDVGHTQAKEVPSLMLLPAFLIIPVMFSISLFPGFYLEQIAGVAENFTHLALSGTSVQRATEIARNIGVGNLVIISVFVLIMTVKRSIQPKKVVHKGQTWGCGYSAGDFRHQYTSTSYTEDLRELAGKLVTLEGSHTAFDEKEIFPGKRRYTTHFKDLIEENLISRPVHYVAKEVPKAGWAQTGKINHYLVYPLVFLTVISLLTVLGLL